MRKFEVKFDFKGSMGIQTQIVAIPMDRKPIERDLVLKALNQINTYPRSYTVIHVKELTDEVTVADKKTPSDIACEVHMETIKVGIQGLFEEGKKVNEVLSIVSGLTMELFADRLNNALKEFKGI